MSTALTRPVPSAPVALAVGDELPASTFGPVTRTDIVRYAGAGGDLNPIHHDETFARAAGLPGVFAMGMLPAGVLGNRLARWVGPDNVRRFAVRFTGQIWPDDVLRLTGTVTAVEGDEATIGLLVTRGDAEPVLRGSATATVAAA
ncbi:MaoC/PaaZ C-terminal domain-containing protein [Patulibacter sp. S7RM1-6]